MCGLLGRFLSFGWSWRGWTWLGVAWFGVGLVGGVGGGGRRNGGVPAIEAYDLGPARLAVGGSCSLPRGLVVGWGWRHWGGGWWPLSWGW